MLVLPPADCLAHAQRPEVAGESLPDKHVLNQPTANTVRPRTSPLLFSRLFSSCSWKAELKENIQRRPTSMICLCRSASSAYDLEDQKRSEKKKLPNAWVPSDLSQNHPQPGPSRTHAIFFNLPRWDGWRWSYWGRTPFRSSRILCCSQQTAAHWLLKQHRLLPFSQEPKGQTADAAKQSGGTWKIPMGHARKKTPNNQDFKWMVNGDFQAFPM